MNFAAESEEKKQRDESGGELCSKVSRLTGEVIYGRTDMEHGTANNELECALVLTTLQEHVRFGFL